MYLHVGQNTVIRTGEIIGIFDMETSTLSQTTRQVLARAEKEGKVVNVSMEMPKSFLLCQNEKGERTCYITQISTATLLKRSGARLDLRGDDRNL
ncbi:MAG: extracellular matrix regulator RemB [Candidatus Heritagella sp.]